MLPLPVPPLGVSSPGLPKSTAWRWFGTEHTARERRGQRPTFDAPKVPCYTPATAGGGTWLVATERIQRRIDRLLDQVEEAVDQEDWEAVRRLSGRS